MIHLYHAAGFYSAEAPEFITTARDWFTKAELLKTNQGFLTNLQSYDAAQPDGHGTKGLKSAQPFMKFLEEQGTKYLLEMGYQVKHPLKVKNLWVNEMTSGQKHARHSHFGYILSGTYYVDMPPGCAGITFETALSNQHRFILPVEAYNLLNSGEWTVGPKSGDLMMWLSYVNHHVAYSEFEGVRRSVAFDLSF